MHRHDNSAESKARQEQAAGVGSIFTVSAWSRPTGAACWRLPGICSSISSPAGMAMVPEGLDMAVRLMVPGEVSTVRAAPGYAYDGRADRPEVCAFTVCGLHVHALLGMQSPTGVLVAVGACPRGCTE